MRDDHALPPSNLGATSAREGGSHHQEILEAKMKRLWAAMLGIGLTACRPVELTPLAAFQTSCSVDIQNETKDLVLKSHNAFHPGCRAKQDSLQLVDFRTVMAKNDAEDYVPTSVARWQVGGCPETFTYETRCQRIRRHQDGTGKDYGISIQPIYGLKATPAAQRIGG
jgi:hypothetical protein